MIFEFWVSIFAHVDSDDHPFNFLVVGFKVSQSDRFQGVQELEILFGVRNHLFQGQIGVFLPNFIITSPGEGASHRHIEISWRKSRPTRAGNQKANSFEELML